MAKKNKSVKNTKASIKRKATIALKESRVFDLRLSGAGWKTIADIVGYADPSGAWRAYDRVMKRLTIDDPETARQLELLRLDRMQIPMWQQSIQGQKGAVDRVLKIMERRAKLLGIDAPEKSEVSVLGGGPDFREVIVNLPPEEDDDDPS